MRMRIGAYGLLLLAMVAAPAGAQTPAASSPAPSAPADDTRRALPTFLGDTGLWFVSTAEVLPANRPSLSVYRANFDLRQGLTDVSKVGVTAAVGLADRVEIFGSWRFFRIDRDVRPLFVPSNPEYGGVSHEYPYQRLTWAEPSGWLVAGAKWSLLSQRRGSPISLAPRATVKIATGDARTGINGVDGTIDLVASGEIAQKVELTSMAGFVLRRDTDNFHLSNGVGWGVGAGFPSRSPVRVLVEAYGEFVTKDNVVGIGPPYVASDGSIAPILSPIKDPVHVNLGAVWQMSNGFFVHAGGNYTAGATGRTIGGNDIAHNGWGGDFRIGWHPGAKVFVAPPPPPPPAPPVVQAAPAPAPPPPPNRNPVFNVNATCNPMVVVVGQVSNCTATAIDPDGDPVTYQWTAPQGAFATPMAQNTAWTAPGQPTVVPITVTARDNRGGMATSTVSVQVVRREEIAFEDVHFDFDRFNLRPDALKILDDAIPKLQANPDLNVTIEGHCDSIGTSEYNIALGERRSFSVRDYLVSRGIATSRLRTVSYGEERPAADNGTAAGRAINRRAHLVVIIQ